MNNIYLISLLSCQALPPSYVVSVQGSEKQTIKLEWQGTTSTEDALDPAKFNQHQHREVNFVDLNNTLVYSSGSADLRVYCKPGTA
jgi:hypothetical protein